MGTSKILIGGVGIDLTADTVAANKMLSGTKAHDSNGDSVTGNIPSKAAQTYTPGTSAQTISAGQYLSGAQTIQGDADLVASNIKSGVNIFGVDGSLQPAKPEQSKTLTLGAAAPSTVTPDSGKVLSSVPVTLDTSVIKAENIKKDVQMLGITGTHEGGGGGELEKFISEGPTTAIFPTVSTIRGYAFALCTSLTTASFPACTTIGSYAFESCSSLTTTSFPVCETLGYHAFYYCTSLTTASFPACTTIGSSAFMGCRRLTTASFPACTTIDRDAFIYCYNLRSLYLLGSSYVNLQFSGAFSSTPIGGYTSSTGGVYGSIYVPRSMYYNYKNRTNWSYFSSRFASV